MSPIHHCDEKSGLGISDPHGPVWWGEIWLDCNGKPELIHTEEADRLNQVFRRCRINRVKLRTSDDISKH